jgi:hypothetical protein
MTGKHIINAEPHSQRFVSRPISEGIRPVSLLDPTARSWRLDSRPISVGMKDDSTLSKRSRWAVCLENLQHGGQANDTKNQ